MYKEYFYEHDDFNPNEVEDLLASREGIYAPIIEKIISRQELTLKEHRTLIEFRHITYYRSNEFIGFHTYKKNRGERSSDQRLDWLRINGIFGSDITDKNIKRSQLKAIQSVISKKDSAYQISSVTPICLVAIAKDRKFVIGDNGSISMGDEFEGMTVIVISPTHALAFPRASTALELMKKIGVTSQTSTIVRLEIDNDLVDTLNERIVDNAFEYYIDPNARA